MYEERRLIICTVISIVLRLLPFLYILCIYVRGLELQEGAKHAWGIKDDLLENFSHYLFHPRAIEMFPELNDSMESRAKEIKSDIVWSCMASFLDTGYIY